MELTEVLLILGVLGTVSSVIMFAISRMITPKKARNAADATSAQLYKTIQSQMDDVTKLKDSQIKSQQNRINYLDKQLNSGEEEEEELPIPPEMLEPIAKKLNMQPAALLAFVNSPQGKKLLKQYKDLLPALPALLGGLGNGQGQNNQVQQSQQMF